MTRRYRQRAGTWGAAANGCGACGTFPAPAADRSPRRGHLKAERSDGAARNGTAGQGGGGGHPPGGEGGPGWAVAPPPPGSRPPAERGRQETCGGCARSEEPTGRPLQALPACRTLGTKETPSPYVLFAVQFSPVAEELKCR
ncbi:uncharacterized protein PRD47_002442 isoform 2-T2 [Ara ararauna]